MDKNEADSINRSGNTTSTDPMADTATGQANKSASNASDTNVKESQQVKVRTISEKEKRVMDTTDDVSESMDSGNSNGKQPVAQHWKTIFALLILLVGACARVAFLSTGFLHAKDNQVDEFDRLADNFAVELVHAFKDYELFGLWIHESCRSRGKAKAGRMEPLGTCSRQDFRELYEHIRSVGLEFQSAQFIPYVRHEDREAVEAEAEAFYEEYYPTINYTGIGGLFPRDGRGLVVLPQEEKEFYWPVHYIEPMLENEEAIDLDIYSSPTQQTTIQHAVESWNRVSPID